MSAKLCPLLMQGIAAGGRSSKDVRWFACVGSRCAAWTTSSRVREIVRSGELVRDGWGRCAHFSGDSYPDPAGGTK